MVNSLHWQGIARLADGLKPEAFAEDGLVEAVRGPDDAAFCLGVQWHPEWAAKSNPVSVVAVPPLRRGREGRRDMTDTRLTIDEAKAFSTPIRGCTGSTSFLFDMNGIARGKRIRRSDLHRRRQERPDDADLGFHHGPARQLRGGDRAACGRPAIATTTATF